ncbi:MAG: hypothetical protein J6N20_05715 [Pseudomonas sp.]|nr:hypothetical protein [Pseudomonas sp.]
MGNATKEVQVTIEQCNERIDMARCLENLLQHPDFNKLIMTGYMEKESHRLTLMLADPSCESPQGQANVVRDLSAVAQLNAYFRKVRLAGEVAARTKKDHEEELEIQLREDLEA